jgi:hypothetical protein
MPTLGGTIIVHNAVRFDYCVCEAAASLCGVCDDVVVLDCQSTDDTLDHLQDLARRVPNLRVIEGGDWNCAENYSRLALLTDFARSHLKTDWHFNLQADEVLHEDDFAQIRQAIREGVYDSFTSRRINFFGDFKHHIRFDLKEGKPVSDIVIRLAHTKYASYMDAEALQVDPATMSHQYPDRMRIFHYGFVRDDHKQIDRAFTMQSWFFGPGGPIDPRIVACKEQGKPFDWREFKSRDLLTRFEGTHPKFAAEWIAARQAGKVPV